MTPAWHEDKPPVPGLYTLQRADGSTRLVYFHGGISAWEIGWYYGPRDGELPDPPPIPEPPKPPRLFRCKWFDDENTLRVGVLFANGTWRTFSPDGVPKFYGHGIATLKREYTDIEFLDGAPA